MTSWSEAVNNHQLFKPGIASIRQSNRLNRFSPFFFTYVTDSTLTRIYVCIKADIETSQNKRPRRRGSCRHNKYRTERSVHTPTFTHPDTHVLIAYSKRKMQRLLHNRNKRLHAMAAWRHGMSGGSFANSLRQLR